MKPIESPEREFKRSRPQDAMRRRNPDEYWDGVSGVYTVRPRTATTGEDTEHPERSKEEVLGVACEPTN